MKKIVLISCLVLFAQGVFSQFICGDTLVDSGGITGTYSNGENDTMTICPTLPGESVQLVFTSFDTETGYDYMYIYEGNSTAGNLIGTYNGTSGPGTIVSEDPTGCFTIVFTSDLSVTNAGWEALINCVPAPTCLRPSDLAATNITDINTMLNWTSNGSETRWVIEYDTTGFVPGTGNTIVTISNPYTLNGLTQMTQYDVYIRAYCGIGDTSSYFGPISFTTDITPLVCGDVFTDSGDTSDYSVNEFYNVTACPSLPGDAIQVIFSQFDIEDGYDFMTIYDGDSVNSTLVGVYTGTTSPGTIVAENTTGCLTFQFSSDFIIPGPGWLAQINCIPAPTCLKPTNLLVSNITNNSLDLGWTANSGETSWLVEYGSPGFIPGTGTAVVANSNPFNVSGLASTSNYDFYVRALCGGTDSSNYSLAVSAMTSTDPFICGSLFTDMGGPNLNYNNSADDTITICPSGLNEVVVLSFTMLNLESGYDSLWIFNGNSTASPLIGAFSGNANPGNIYSTSADGCLTAVFSSDGSVNLQGWSALISCVPPVTCFTPTNLSVANLSETTADVSWTNSGSETQWVLEYGPAGFTPGSGNTMLVNTNPYTITGLNATTQYDFYVSAYCAADDTSFMAGPATFSTTVAPFVCGNTFYDNGGPNSVYSSNSSDTITICPLTPLDTLRITFTTFSTELNYDSLMIFDGNSTSSPLIGSYMGTNSPGIITASNPSGCLTFVFISDGSFQDTGWVAQIECFPFSNLGLEEQLESGLNIYPNPTQGILHLNNNQDENYELMLLDIHGRKIALPQTGISAMSADVLDLNYLENGMYFLHVSNQLHGMTYQINVIK